VGVRELLKRSTQHTLELLRMELEVQLHEQQEHWHFASLERIFIENRIYRDIEECETWEAVLEAIDSGLKPHIAHLIRPVTQEDLVRLTEIRIKRISKFDADKANDHIAALEGRMAEIKHHLEHLVAYAVAYFKDLRVAAGAPDTRNKLITEGRLVTRGILFDSGSDRIKPESYGTLKEIGTVLTENPGVRVRIIGHTDSDGEEAVNLELSKRRAAAVREALVKEFAVDGGRLETDGKGEGTPAGPNDSPQGKANNRRVEFVKL
jgi:outer membrane protein OmpA-like peptidoglycan-associated protein